MGRRQGKAYHAKVHCRTIDTVGAGLGINGKDTREVTTMSTEGKLYEDISKVDRVELNMGVKWIWGKDR